MHRCSDRAVAVDGLEHERDPLRPVRLQRLEPLPLLLDAPLLAVEDDPGGQLPRPGECVVPGVAAVARLLGAQAVRDVGAPCGPPECDLVARRDVRRDDDRVLGQVGAARPFVLGGVLVAVRRSPGRQLGAGHREPDAVGQRVGVHVRGDVDLLVALEHRPVDGRAAGGPQLFDERRLDYGLARRQHQLELGAVVHVGLGVPVGPHRADDRQPDVLDEDPVEVQLGLPSRMVSARLDAEADAPPLLDVDSVVQEVPAVDVSCRCR